MGELPRHTETSRERTVGVHLSSGAKSGKILGNVVTASRKCRCRAGPGECPRPPARGDGSVEVAGWTGGRIRRPDDVPGHCSRRRKDLRNVAGGPTSFRFGRAGRRGLARTPWSDRDPGPNRRSGGSATSPSRLRERELRRVRCRGADGQRRQRRLGRRAGPHRGRHDQAQMAGRGGHPGGRGRRDDDRQPGQLGVGPGLRGATHRSGDGGVDSGRVRALRGDRAGRSTRRCPSSSHRRRKGVLGRPGRRRAGRLLPGVQSPGSQRPGAGLDGRNLGGGGRGDARGAAGSSLRPARPW